MESQSSCPLHNLYIPNIGCTNFAPIAAVIVAAIIYIVYKLSTQIVDLIYKAFTVSIDISGPMEPCGDIHRFILDWLDKNSKTLQHQSVTSHTERDEVGKTTTKFQKTPTFETNLYFTYNGVLIQVSRTRLGIVKYEVPWESVTLRVFRWNRTTLDLIESELLEKFEGEEEDTTKTRFFFAQDGSYWNEMGSKRKRPLDSVILNESLRELMVKDVHEFLSTENWYRDRGIPYRRGYLLYGPPGNGKSSFVKAIAGEIGYNICILSLSAKNLNDDSLNHLMNTTEEKCIILLEDIDAAFPSRQQQELKDDEQCKKSSYAGEETNGTSSGKVTLRGLLNALDGVASTEGRIVFLTTNYIEKLDPAMTRPGRVDMKVYINYPDDDQLGRMFKRFYPEATDEDSKKFVTEIGNLKKSVSMAMVQGLFMMYKKSFQEAIENIDKYFTEQFFELQ